MLTGVMSGVTLVEQRIRLSMGLPNQTKQAYGPACMEGIVKPFHSWNDSGLSIEWSRDTMQTLLGKPISSILN